MLGRCFEPTGQRTQYFRRGGGGGSCDRSERASTAGDARATRVHRALPSGSRDLQAHRMSRAGGGGHSQGEALSLPRNRCCLREPTGCAVACYARVTVLMQRCLEETGLATGVMPPSEFANQVGNDASRFDGACPPCVRRGEHGIDQLARVSLQGCRVLRSVAFSTDCLGITDSLAAVPPEKPEHMRASPWICCQFGRRCPLPAGSGHRLLDLPTQCAVAGHEQAFGSRDRGTHAWQLTWRSISRSLQ